MKKGIVIIPAWRRPEFLGACLRYIMKSSGYKDYQYFITIDEGGMVHENQLAIKLSEFDGYFEVHEQRRRFFRGNSYNVIHALVSAQQKGFERIHLIEEDVFVGKDYFIFHEGLSTLHPEAFFISACENQNAKAPKTDQPESAFWKHCSYQSLGVSFPPSSIEQISELINDNPHPNYFTDPIAFCVKHFPDSPLAASQSEQDGLIHRIVIKNNYFGIYPIVGRAYHAGYYGYNRPGTPMSKELPLAYRIERLLEMTDDEMNRNAGVHKDIKKPALIDSATSFNYCETKTLTKL